MKKVKHEKRDVEAPKAKSLTELAGDTGKYEYMSTDCRDQLRLLVQKSW